MNFPAVEVEIFQKLCRSTLRGFCTVIVPQLGLRIYDVSVYEQNRSRWAMPPAKAALDHTARNLKRGADGRPFFTPALAFTDPNTSRAFSQRVVNALLALDPTAFDCEQQPSTFFTSPTTRRSQWG